jgi:hypothetical protein
VCAVLRESGSVGHSRAALAARRSLNPLVQGSSPWGHQVDGNFSGGLTSTVRPRGPMREPIPEALVPGGSKKGGRGPIPSPGASSPRGRRSHHRRCRPRRGHRDADGGALAPPVRCRGGVGTDEDRDVEPRPAKRVLTSSIRRSAQDQRKGLTRVALVKGRCGPEMNRRSGCIAQSAIEAA